MTYEPQGARAWPESLPTAAVLQVYDSRRPIRAGQERFCGSDVALHCLEGQVSLIHHVMAFEEASGGRKILSDTQRWKAQFAAYFLWCREPGAAVFAGADGRLPTRLAWLTPRQTAG